MSHRESRDNNNNNYYKRKSEDSDGYRKRDNKYDDVLRDEGNKRLRELQTYGEGDKSKQHTHSSRDNRDRYNKKNKNENFDYSNYKFGKNEDEENNNKPKIIKEKPDFKPSGSLKNDSSSNYGSNSRNKNNDENDDDSEENKIKLKWHEPVEAKLPNEKWMLYPFKGKEQLDTIYLHRKKSFLFGRNRDIADIPIDHPSCSSQHAVIVFRIRKKEDPNTGSIKTFTLPYIIDLESTNGTFLKGEKIEPAKYFELRSKDKIKFGTSTREYILLCEDSISDDDDDDDDQEDSD
ncbi:hypothetical protein RB653_005503 [Dictyostelium firmibasis]|uniref:FHA domain-containing protein n=1 Tax=Dictyostelium firmibasis TaxID=79012 RepID=A0AAN7U1F4_9MYCE